MAALEQMTGSNAGTVFELEDGQLLVGRSEECGVVLNFPSVSRKHCLIREDAEGFFLRDLGSRNQTRLNGRKINSDEKLMNGDEIQVSTTTLRFLAQDSLSQESGTWGNRPKLISIDNAEDDSEAEEEKSVRRQMVTAGQQITNEELGSGQLNALRIVARLDVADGSGGWPVLNDSAVKLNQVMQLLHSIRRMTTVDDILGRSLRLLFGMFPLAQNIAVVFRNEDSDGICVETAASRHPTEEVQICTPVIRQVMQHREALLFADHWKSETTGKIPSGTLKSIMACPLNDTSPFCSGAIQIDCTAEKQSFEAADLERLAILSHTISVLIEQAKECENRIRRQSTQAMRDSAERLHEHFQPSQAPNIPGYRLTHGLIARRNLCTDLVDYVSFEDSRVGVMMIDCPQNSVLATPDAVLTSRILSAALLETGSPAAAITKLEDELSERSGSGFDGLSVGVLLIDPAAGSIRFSTAGYLQLLRIRGGVVSAVPLGTACGPPLGLDYRNYVNTTLRLKPEDKLCVFSNGILGVLDSEGSLQAPDHTQSLLQSLLDGETTSLPISVCLRLKEYQASELLLEDIAFTMLARTQDILVADADAALLIESGTTSP